MKILRLSTIQPSRITKTYLGVDARLFSYLKRKFKEEQRDKILEFVNGDDPDILALEVKDRMGRTVTIEKEYT